MLKLPKNTAKRADILLWADQWTKTHFRVGHDEPLKKQTTALLNDDNKLEFCTIEDACQQLDGNSDYIKIAKCLRFNLRLSTWLLDELKKIYQHDFQQLAVCNEDTTLHVFEQQVAKLSAMLAIGSSGIESFQFLDSRLIEQLQRHQKEAPLFAPVVGLPYDSIKALKASIDDAILLLRPIENHAEHIKTPHSNGDDIQRLRATMGGILRMMANDLQPYHLEAIYKGRSFNANKGDNLVLLSMPFSPVQGGFPKFNGCYSMSVSILQNVDDAQLGMNHVINRMVDVTIHPFWHAEQTSIIQNKFKESANCKLGLTQDFINKFNCGEQPYYQPSLLFDARVSKSVGNFNEYSLIVQSWVELCHHNVVPNMFVVDEYHNAAKLWALGFEPYACEQPTIQAVRALADAHIDANTLNALMQDATLVPPQQLDQAQPEKALRLFHYDMRHLTIKAVPAFSTEEPKTWADKIAQNPMLDEQRCTLPNMAGIPVRPIVPSFVQLLRRPLGLKPVNQLIVKPLDLKQKLLDSGEQLAQLGGARTNEVLTDAKKQFTLIRK